MLGYFCKLVDVVYVNASDKCYYSNAWLFLFNTDAFENLKAELFLFII